MEFTTQKVMVRWKEVQRTTRISVRRYVKGAKKKELTVVLNSVTNHDRTANSDRFSLSSAFCCFVVVSWLYA
ncbi:hypothetical protein P8452_44650 [Trifolium repens]|nr:hypothetical protein P8452_44650 [Trifolium repens]